LKKEGISLGDAQYSVEDHYTQNLYGKMGFKIGYPPEFMEQ